VRRNRRRWHFRPGKFVLVIAVVLVALGVGLLFGRVVGGLLASARSGGAAEPTTGTGQPGTGGTQPTTGGTQPTTGGTQPTTGTTPPTTGTTDPAIAEVAFKLPSVAIFTVQAGRFDSRDNATQLVTALTKAGYPAWGTETPPYKVFVGLFADKKVAATLTTKLKTDRPECSAAWTTSIAAPLIDKQISGTDAKMLTAAAAGLKSVAEIISREAALSDARSRGTLKAADLTALCDAYRDKLKTELADLRAATGGDAALREHVMSVILLAQGNLSQVADLAATGTDAKYNAAVTSLLRLTETYADAVVLLTPTGQ
jgi:hypothetical protein